MGKSRVGDTQDTTLTLDDMLQIYENLPPPPKIEDSVTSAGLPTGPLGDYARRALGEDSSLPAASASLTKGQKGKSKAATLAAAPPLPRIEDQAKTTEDAVFDETLKQHGEWTAEAQEDLVAGVDAASGIYVRGRGSTGGAASGFGGSSAEATTGSEPQPKRARVDEHGSDPGGGSFSVLGRSSTVVATALDEQTKSASPPNMSASEYSAMTAKALEAVSTKSAKERAVRHEAGTIKITFKVSVDASAPNASGKQPRKSPRKR